jgi:ribonuclease P/MRP protein subunit RPP40
LEFLELLTSAVDKGDSVDVIFLDFAKAFDKVPHKRLVAQLQAHGVGGKVLKWITAWLRERKQRVALNGAGSSWQDVSGVPQGSVLGPILFLIFINNLDAMAQMITILKKFADDTKLGQVIQTPSDSEKLQNCLDRFTEWAAQWGMSFNVSKCKVMHVGARNPGHAYNMEGVQLSTTKEERDIGVTVSNNLRPGPQCAKAAKTASAVLRQIARAFHFRDRFTFISLYKQYVRPHLEFAVQAWNSWTQQDIEVLERVQKRAVGMVSGLRGATYKEKS